MINRRNFIGGAGLLPLVLTSGAGAEDAPLLTAGTRVIEVHGRAATVFGLTNPAGSIGLTLNAGERFRADLANTLTEDTLVHWHGLTPPSAQDGVPMLSQPPLPPGGRYSYSFANTRTGTHWMHSHVGLQEQKLLAAPLIIRDPEESRIDEQEHVVMLHDFTFRDPAAILAELQAGGGGHADHGTMDHGSMEDGMTMPAMLNDVSFDAYLANDRTLADPEVVRVEAGGRIRLRIINAAAASNMWVDLGAIAGELIAVDGNPVQPVRGSRFPLAIAQRADIRLLLPKEGGAWPVLFRPEGVRQQAGLILASGDAVISRLAAEGDVAPAVDLSLEEQLAAALPLKPSDNLRTEMLHLGGGGADYLWTLNGKSGMHDTLFSVRSGERIEIAMMNMTTMAHPMHLHGHHFQVVGLKGRRIAGAMRDTVLVPPMETVVIAFDADNPGTWAFHCHHVYHMNSGMMGALAYVNAA